jgi:hypothetical protein
VLIAMRDGVKLAANVFLPTGAGPWPVIVERTPYDKDGPVQQAVGASEKYTSAGYAFLVEDVRGKGHSEGFFTPFANDLEDGFDTVEWAAKQPWANGKVGVDGPSAMGITANLAAISDPPHLVAAYTLVTPLDLSYFVYPGGVLREGDWITWSKAVHENDEQIKSIYDGTVANYTQRKSEVGAGKDYIRVPIYHVGGWYDVFDQGVVDAFTYLQNLGAPGARGNQKLYMGPVGHGPLSGDLVYPGFDSQTATADEMRWWDHWLKGVDNGVMDEPPVHVVMMAGAQKGSFSPKNRLMAFANWPPTGREVRYYPIEDHSLAAMPQPQQHAQLSYRFDPANPVPTVGGANNSLPLGPMDQRKIPARQDYLRFETPPLTGDVAIAGRVTVDLWAATDGPDTDFMAKLVDVYPDGYEALVLDAPVRASFRHGRKPGDIRPMEPGAPEKMTIDLASTALTFERGHRIQLVLTSSNAPKFEVSRNNGAPSGDKAQPSRVARNTIFLDAGHPTALVLPVIYPDDMK